MAPILKVAACHASPIYLNAAETTTKTISLINQAADNGADLVVFPETFIPAFPFWSTIISPSENHGFFIKMAKESVYSDGPEIEAVRAVIRERKVYVSLGISEKVRYSSATLFNANLLIGPDGVTLVHHRKLQATFFEKLTWSMGDGNGLQVIECNLKDSTPANPSVAKVGALICGENTNPLARYSMIAQGEQFHISTWPAVAPMAPVTRKSLDKDAQRSESGAYDNLALNRMRCAAQCVEGKCFGVLCAGFMSEQMINTLVSMAPETSKEVVELTMRHSPQAETLFLGPSGAPIPGYTINSTDGSRQVTSALREEEGILYADVNMDATIEGKQYHDVVGGYQRLDVFDLKVNRTRNVPIKLS